MKLEALQNIPLSQRLIVAGFFLALLVGGFVYFIYMPKSEQTGILQGELSRLTQEVQVNRNKVKRLDELKVAYVLLQEQLGQQLEQLPKEAEVPILLRQLSELGTRMGLEIKLWRPVQQKPSPTGLYTEVPVEVQVSGSYHSVGMFFDRISRLRRIINITNLKMGSPRQERGKVVVQVSFNAVAFALLPGSGPGSGTDQPI